MASSSSGPSRRDTEDLLVLTCVRLTRLYNQVLARLDVPLTYRQHRTLVRVGEGHSSVAVLANLGNISMPTVSESIGVLVRRGFLTRRESPDDRRLTVIELTPLGVQASRAAQRALDDASRSLLTDLPEAAHELFHEALTAVYDTATAYFKSEAEDDVASATDQPKAELQPTGKSSPRRRNGSARPPDSREGSSLFTTS